MDPQLLLNKPKPISRVNPTITRVSALVLVSEESKKSSAKLKKIFETRTYQKKTQVTVLDRYKRKLDSLNKANEKRTLRKKQTKLNPPEIKKYVGEFFSPGGDALKTFAGLSALGAFENFKKGDWAKGIGSTLLTVGALGGLGLGGLGMLMSRGGKGAPAAPGGKFVGTPYSQTKAGQAYAGMQAQRNLPKWAQKAAGGSSSRFAASNQRLIQGSANIGDRARLATGGRFSVGNIAERIATRGGAAQASTRAGGTAAAKAAGVGARAIPLLGAAVNIGLSAYRFNQGDVVGGILSAVSAIPVVGWAALGIDLAREFGAFDGTFLGRKGQDKLKKQTEEQKKLVEKKKESRGGLTFRKTLDRYERVVNKFEEFVKGFKTTSQINAMKEGGNANPPPPSPNPYTGPISKDSFWPLPGGVLTPGDGQYGADRDYDGGHSGQDVGGLPGGSPVVAWKTGTVTVSPGLEGPDNIITIDHGNGIKTVYKHVVATVGNGELVYGGQQIATLLPGKEEVRGRKWETHLHFEVWKGNSHINPNQDLSASQRIPSPIDPRRAKQQHESLSQDDPTTGEPRRFRQSTAEALRKAGQHSAAATAERQQTFHASESLIDKGEKITITADRKDNIISQTTKPLYQPQVINVPYPVITKQSSSNGSGGGGIMISGINQEQALNTYYKKILLNSVG